MPRYRQSEARWVYTACVAGAYLVLVASLFIVKMGTGLSLPVSVAVSAPPLIYAAVSMVVLRQAPFVRRLSWVGSACVVHLGLGVLAAIELAWAAGLSFGAALAQVFVLFPPAPVATLVATPFTLWAFGVTASKPARRVQGGPRPAPPAPPKPIASPLRAGKLTPGMAAPPASPVRPSTSLNAAAVPPPFMSHPPSPPTPPAPAPVAAVPPPAPVVPAAPLAAPVANQPPKPTNRGEDGMVRVSFARIAPQLPAEAFVLPIDRLGESLREPNVVVVPRRVVLSQMRGGAVAITWGHIAAQFPDLALGMSGDEFRKQYPDLQLWLPADELVSQLPPGTIPGAPAAEAPVAVTPPAPITPSAPVTPPAPVIPTRPIMAPANGGTTAPPRLSQPRAVAPVSPALARHDHEVLERVVACFGGVGNFEAAVQRIGGNPVVTLTEPTLSRDAVSAWAGQLLRSMGGAAGDVVTARTKHAVLVLAVASTPIVIAASLPGAPVALLVLRAVRAAAAAGEGAARLSAPARRALEPVTVDGRVAQAAQALRSFGAVAPTAFADGAARVYVFRAGGGDGKAVAALALDVCDALGAAGALGPLRAVILRRGGEHTLVRPLAGTAGVLAATGTVTRPGRLLGDADRAALVLEAV